MNYQNKLVYYIKLNLWLKLFIHSYLDAMICERCWNNTDWIHTCTPKIIKLIEKVSKHYPSREKHIINITDPSYLTDTRRDVFGGKPKPNLVEVVKNTWYEASIETITISNKKYYVITFIL